VAGIFLKNILQPIAFLVNFVGAAQFEWVSGIREPMEEPEPEMANCDSEDAVQKKKKRLCKSSPPGEHSSQKLHNAISAFFDSPKHMAEVMAQLKSLLDAPFEDCCHSDRLACPNGVINLRTWELLPIAKPGDFFTSACVTPYDPTASVEVAMLFFENLFPFEHYPYQTGLVRCLQQWLGYSILLLKITRVSICRLI